MATEEEGGATANTTSSSYGGGGAGGKFRKRPFRGATTPYDRPPTAVRGNNNNDTSSWLTKLVVDPASKLISYGAERFFASVFRKRLPVTPPSQPPEANADVSDGVQGAVLNSIEGMDLKNTGVDWKKDNILQSQEGAKEPVRADCSQPINSSSSNSMSELEQLLKQKTFTRSEIVHLTELLQSRAVEAPLGDCQKNEETPSHQQFTSGPLEENRNRGIISSAVMSTPVLNSKVLEDDVAAPAELAKAYMGSRPSKVSPPVLGLRSQVGREDTALLSNIPFASKSPVGPLTKKASASSLAAPENGFITPRSRGRSAIYNMARTPYSRVHPTSILKGSVTNDNGYAGPSMSSPSLSLVENGDKFESQPMTLKRRSSVLDAGISSVGPIRRIRQKPNLLASRIHHSAHGLGLSSHARQNLQLIGEPSHNVSKIVGENENESVPSTSYARVPSKSSEVAARIFQHLEKLSPKEKPSESKLVTAREKSPSKFTPTMLSGKAIRTMEDVGSSKLVPDVLDDHKLGTSPIATLPDARYSSFQKHGKVEENSSKESFLPSDNWNTATNNDSAVSIKASGLSNRAIDSIVKNGSSQPPQKKRAFRMSAQEDSVEQDDDVHCNGLASGPVFGKKGQMEASLMDSKLVPAEEPGLLKTTIQPEDKTSLGFMSKKTIENSNPGALTVGQGSGVVSFSASEEAQVASQSAVLPLSAAVFDKPKEANNPPPLFSISSKLADKFPSLPSESSQKAESKLESSCSLNNFSPSASSQVKVPEFEDSSQLNPPKAADINVKSDIVASAASNGPPVSSPPMSFTAASPNDTNKSTSGAFPFISSTGSAKFGADPSTSPSVTSTSSIFGFASQPTSAGGSVFKFGSSVDTSTAASATPTSSTPEVAADQRTKAEMDPSLGSSSSSSQSTVAAFAATSSGSNTFGFGSSFSNSTTNNLHGSLFASASKSQVSEAGTVPVSQSTSVQSGSSASLPSFNINGSTSFGSSPTNSQLFNSSTTFGFSSLASSSDTSTVVPGTGPTSNTVKFGSSSTILPEGTAGSSSSSATPAIFGFGFGSSSSTNAVGSTSSATPSVFSFGSNSSGSASVFNTAGSFSSGTSGTTFSFGLNPSASSSTTNSVSSNAAPPNVCGSNWQSPKSPIFGSSLTSPSPSTGFSFGASSSSAAPMPFNSSSSASSSPLFPFTSASASVLSTPSSQPVFGNPPTTGFAVSPGNNDQMNAEDSMAEDPVQTSAPSVPVFGQPSVSPSPSGFAFGSAAPSQPNTFMFGGQQNQVAPQNPSPFQASGSLEFNAGGSFSLGSGGGDKSGRKIVKINRNKNRKK